MGRHRFPAVLAGSIFIGTMLVTTGCRAAQPAPGSSSSRPGPPSTAYPSSMAALGDSTSVGFGTCLLPAACRRNSWTTGAGTRVNSHYRRLLQSNPAIHNRAQNFAAVGATTADLAGQANRAVRAGAEYVTILIGANDACRSSLDRMTAVTTFRQRLDDALGIISRGLPNTRVLIVSIPDVYRVWEVGRTNRAALAIWSTGICPALLARPSSTAPEDMSRREVFRKRIDDYNAQLSGTCAAHRHCRYDGGAVHRAPVTLDLLNIEDFFHPSASGQNALARLTYPGRFTW